MAAAPSSSLENLLAALDTGADRALSEHSVVLQPFWKQSGKLLEPSTAVGLQRIPAPKLPRFAQLRIRLEEQLLSQLKPHFESENPALTAEANQLLVKFLNELPHLTVTDSNPGHLGYKALLLEAVITKKNKKLCEVLADKARAVSRRLVNQLLRWFVKAKMWEPICTLVASGLVSANEFPELIDHVVEAGHVPLACLCIKWILDLRPSHHLQLLKLFLADDARFRDSFQLHRRVWRSVVTNFINRTVEYLQKFSSHPEIFQAVKTSHGKGQAAMERRACIELAAAFDGFDANELCLHLMLTAKIDESVLVAVLSRLDNSEVLPLLRYLNKWLAKFCSTSLKLRQRAAGIDNFVPALHLVVRWAAGILESRYASLVLARDFRNEVAVTERHVSSLLGFGKRLANLEGIVDHLARKIQLPSDTSGVEASQHIIEYLEIS